MTTLTKKYIFEQKLKGEPITIPREESMELLEKYSIIKPGNKEGRYYVLYPVLMHGGRVNGDTEAWTVLNPGQRIVNRGDVWLD